MESTFHPGNTFCAYTADCSANGRWISAVIVEVAEATVAALTAMQFQTDLPAVDVANTRPAVPEIQSLDAGLILTAVFLITAAPAI